ncbi:MAG TPA: M67 family metallopeptidase [Blastocatellia bacterium]|nr:M67 family metallopeptidase [Blastocatellia bacterium]
MSIKLTQEHLDQIRRHGERTFPEECGGLLLGMLDGETRVIHETLPLENIRKDSRHNRVELSPLDYAKAEREATKRGLGVWGYYHSHPNHPAIPSGFDLEHAPFIEWSYLIVSVRDGVAQEVRAWTVREDRSQFDEEDLLLPEVTPSA